MFGIKYETWKAICSMYFSLNIGSKKAYLQWFPFSKLSDNDQERISSEEFFDKYIANGGFVFFPAAMHHSENYIQKGDSSFRDAALVSPILFLVIQCLGKEISDRYVPERPLDMLAFYAGNYETEQPRYKRDYDNFYKSLNDNVETYQFFIKTDITNFFSNINLDILIQRINEICNYETVTITQTQLHLIKELLAYCGDGKYPLIECSMASSYLATIVYLDAIDCRLHQFITNKVNTISSFKMIRYVDDLYILFSSTEPLSRLNETYNDIRNEYSSILKDYGLALNIKKCCIKESFNINEELKKSRYDEIMNGQKHDIEELFPGSLLAFLSEIYDELSKDGIDSVQYNNLVDSYFYSEDIEFTPTEVYNYFIYENETELTQDEVTSKLVDIINRDISFLSVDPKRLSIMVMKSGNDKVIKAMLNRLFERHRADIWNSYDTTVAIAYLIQSKFQHIDLLNVIRNRCPLLYEYYRYNCGSRFLSCFNNSLGKCFLAATKSDTKAIFLYFMYLMEKNQNNHLGKYAFYKNFFDRISADAAYDAGIDRDKKPNYKKYYKEGAFKTLYCGIENSDLIIEKAHKLRNSNPIAHSSAELIDNNDSEEDIKKAIADLNSLIEAFIRNKNLYVNW